MNCKLYNGLSPWHGRGLFSYTYIEPGTVIFKAFSADGRPTELGSLLNASHTPNVTIRRYQDGCYYAVAAIPIFSGIEICYADKSGSPQTYAFQ
jgi:hypothetical protein